MIYCLNVKNLNPDFFPIQNLDPIMCSHLVSGCTRVITLKVVGGY
jgi:hypothetical protein